MRIIAVLLANPIGLLRVGVQCLQIENHRELKHRGLSACRGSRSLNVLEKFDSKFEYPELILIIERNLVMMRPYMLSAFT
jgi:hypothetical protein